MSGKKQRIGQCIKRNVKKEIPFTFIIDRSTAILFDPSCAHHILILIARCSFPWQLIFLPVAHLSLFGSPLTSTGWFERVGRNKLWSLHLYLFFSFLARSILHHKIWVFFVVAVSLSLSPCSVSFSFSLVNSMDSSYSIACIVLCRNRFAIWSISM